MFQDATIQQTLALFVGLYFLAAGGGVLLDRQTYVRMLGEFQANSALTFVTGAFAFAVGAAMVALHNDWSGASAAIVSFVGWAALIKGMAIMLLRGRLLDLYGGMRLGRGFSGVAGVVAVLLGAWLVFAALTA